MMQTFNKHDPKLPRPKTSIYLDDVMIVGCLTDDTWRDSLYIIIMIAIAGMPIAIGKCQLFLHSIALLGVYILQDEYMLG